jgi:hypothetical protein
VARVDRYKKRVEIVARLEGVVSLQNTEKVVKSMNNVSDKDRAVPMATEAKYRLYTVNFSSEEVQTYSGSMEVTASTREEAERTVQTKIDSGDVNSVFSNDFGAEMSFGDLEGEVGVHSVDEGDEVDAEMLTQVVQGLEAEVVWDAIALAKRRAFLASLLLAQPAA